MKLNRSLLFPFRVAVGIWLGFAVIVSADTFTVTSTADSDPGSLRNTLFSAGSGDTIVFDNSLSGQTIRLTSGPLVVLQNLTIDASALAGGIFIDGNSNSTVMEIYLAGATLNGLIITNGYNNSSAGGLYTSDNATLTLNHCTIAGNFGYCGGMSVYQSSTVTLNDCIISENSSTNDGGVGGIESSYSTLTLNHCTVSGNSATNAQGGGIRSEIGALTLNDCALSGNSAYGGGGIYGAASVLTLNNCMLSGNSALYGGGISTAQNTNVFNNCTFAGNVAAVEGGGLLSLVSTNFLNQCTLANNVAGAAGGGIALYDINYPQWLSTISMTNTVAAGNTASNGPDVFGTYEGANDFVGGNPRLAPLGNYGGPTQTMAPLFGSPVIDAGADSTTNFLAADQRGYPRLSGTHVDIGAVEARIAPANNPPLLKNVAWVPAGGGNAFQFTFTNVAQADFTVLTSTNLTLPSANWTASGNAGETAPGQYQFTDMPATNNAHQFYRIVSP